MTRLHDEFEPLRALLLARCLYVSLIDSLAEVRVIHWALVVLVLEDLRGVLLV
jgi:hypothetical protein